MNGGKFSLRNSDDTSNPTAPRLYDLGLTAGRLTAYLPNASGNRTAFMSILQQGARTVGDTHCHRLIKVIYAGFELPEYDANGDRNWLWHDGRIPVVPTWKICTATASTNKINCTAHGYNNGDEIAFIKRGAAAVIGDPLAKNTKYFVVNKTTNDFQVSLTEGGAAIDLTTDSSGLIHVYRANAGIFDPVQGLPLWFASIGVCLAGLSYIEILLPAELSNGTDEPTKLKVILDGKMVLDYSLDEDGELVAGAPVPSINPALIALDVLVNDGGLALTRFGGASWLEWRDRNAEKIDWIGGNDSPATPVDFETVASGLTYDGAGKLTKTVSGTTAKFARTEAISKPNMSIEALYNGGDVYLQFSTAGNLDGSTAVNGIKIESNILYYWVAGVPEVLADCYPSDRVKISYEYGIFKVYRNSVPVSLEGVTVADQPNADIYMMLGIGTEDAFLSDIRVMPSGSNSVPRQVERATGGIVISTKNSIAEVFETEIHLSAGVSWQDVDGRIEILTTPARTPVLTLNANPADNAAHPENGVCNVKSCIVKPRDPAANPNFYTFAFRDRDDAILTRRYVNISRPERRAEVGHIPSGGIDYGVLTQSQMERIGETRARLNNDLDLTWTVEAFLDTLELAKGDFAWLTDDASGFTVAEPAKVMVLSELLLPNGDVEIRKFEVMIITDDFYSDTAHGRVIPFNHSHVEQKFVAPPPAAALVLTEVLRAYEDSAASAIEGLVTFGAGAGQTGRVFIRKLGDDEVTWGSWRETGITVVPDPNTNQGGFALEAIEIGVYQIRVATYSAGGVTGLFENQKTTEIEITGDASAPTEPEKISVVYDGIGLKWVWSKSPSPNVKGYQIRNQFDELIVEFTSSLTFSEILNTSAVTRRVFAVSRSGVLSEDYAALTYTASGAHFPPDIQDSTNRGLTGFNADGVYTGRDTAVIPTSVVNAVVDAQAVNSDGSVNVSLGVTITDEHLQTSQADSVEKIKVEVFNQFGESVKEITPQTFNGAGLVVCNYQRNFADAFEQAYFKIQLRNAFGYNSPVYLNYDNSLSTSPPTPKVRANCPLDLSGTVLSDTQLRLAFAFSANVDVFRRVVGTLDWTEHANNVSANPYDAETLSPVTEYEFQLRSHSVAANRSNIIRLKTLQSGSSAPSRPAPTGLTFIQNPTHETSQLKADWIRNATDNDNVEVWVDGSLFSTESASTIQKILTSLSEGVSKSIKVRNKWTSGTTYSAFSNEVTTATAVTPAASAPSIDSVSYDSTAQDATVNFTPHGGAGTFKLQSSATEFGTYADVSGQTAIGSGLTATTFNVPRTGSTQTKWYRIARNDVGAPDFSAPVSVSIPALDPATSPIDCVIYDDNGGSIPITIRWTNRGAAGNNAVYRKRGYSGSWNLLGSVDFDEFEYIDNDSVGSKSVYYYKVVNSDLPDNPAISEGVLINP